MSVLPFHPAVLTDTDDDGILDDYTHDAGINFTGALPDTGNSPLQLLWLALASILAGMFLILRSRNRKGALTV